MISILSQFTLLLDLQVVDPSQSYAFPMNIVALLPYLILHYEDVNKLCVRSAENIAQVCTHFISVFNLLLANLNLKLG